MSNVAKLKKQAAELELKKQFDKALGIYIKLLENFDENAAELDVNLFNRVGDLLLRQGNVADAVDYYEQAIDRYADTGFFNNAIALCNKVLRHSPGRASVYYKLGKISAQKGFKNDAKVNFLEYADRMQKAGNVDESFRALKEFADLCPDQDEIRLTLAEQLTRADRKAEAIEQLQLLYEKYDSEGRTSEALATANRMRAIDPTVEPRSSGGGRRKTTSGDLIFIDLDDTPSPRPAVARPATPPPQRAPIVPPAATPRSATPPRLTPPNAAPRSATPPIFAPPTATPRSATPPTFAPPTATPRSATPPTLTPPSTTPATPVTPPASVSPTASMTPAASATPATQQEPSFNERPTIITNAIEPAAAERLIDDPMPDISRVGDDSLGIIKSTPSASVLGFESTRLTDDLDATPTSTPLLDIEPTSLTPERSTPIDRSSTPTHAMRDQAPTPASDLEIIMPPEPTPPASAASIEFDVSDLTEPPAGRATPESPVVRETPITPQAALEGLPLMDLETPEPPPAKPASTPPDPMTLSSDLELVEPAADAEFRAESASETGEAQSLEAESEVLATSESPAMSSETLAEDEETSDDDEDFEIPTPSAARKSTLEAAHSVEVLRASVDADPDNLSLRRQLAEAMLEAGDREGGIRELELAMTGAERVNDLDLAGALAEELARLEPESVKHHQKRVEYAFRMNDRARLVEAYVALADTLLRAEQPDKARTVYQRVLDLAPDDVRAQSALEAIAALDAPPPPPPPPPETRRRTNAPTPPAAHSPRRGDDGGFVNLGDWLRDTEAPKDTRMVVAEQEPTGDEDADFADMLRKFKQGVAENVDPEDYQSHYDLAIAFKEMGLLDEAISEFQKALGSPVNRLPTYEALGQCFLEKGQPKLATSILSRALNEKASEDQLIGVLYLLGRAAELQGNVSDAVNYYQRVFVLDIQFRDTADRLNELERAAR